jgi:hypothetical protein
VIKFYARPVHELDEAETLVGTTVQWSQECQESSEQIDQFLTLIAAALLGALFLGSFGGPQAEKLAMAACGLFVLGLLIVLFGHHLCTVHYELTFYDTGAIAMPRGGVRGWLFGPQILGDHRQIATIQIQEEEIPYGDPQKPRPHQRKRYEVWFYFTSGHSLSVAESLFRPEAHHVNELLNQALAEIRKAASQAAFNNGLAWAEVLVE